MGITLQASGGGSTSLVCDDSQATDEVVVSFGLIVLSVALSLMFSGCSNRDLDLKTSNCSARIDFNCNCEKDSSLLTDTAEVIRD